MPLITTFATLSARGFGLFGRQKVLTTVTFPGGTTTWTAPFGVTSLVSLVGKGQDGAGGYYYNTQYSYIYLYIRTGASSYANPPPAPTVADSCLNTIVNYINSLSGLQYIGDQTFSPVLFIYAAQDFSWFYQTNTSTTPSVGWDGGGWVVGGTAAAASDFNTTDLKRWYVTYQTYSFPYTGANTTAFGYTFPGGVEVPATTFTYNNVPVTPGTTYTIVNNGSVTITYYV